MRLQAAGLPTDAASGGAFARRAMLGFAGLMLALSAGLWTMSEIDSRRDPGTVEVVMQVPAPDRIDPVPPQDLRPEPKPEQPAMVLPAPPPLPPPILTPPNLSQPGVVEPPIPAEPQIPAEPRAIEPPPVSGPKLVEPKPVLPARPEPQRAEPQRAEPRPAPWPRLFGTVETRSDNLRPFTKWTSTLDRYEKERALEVAPCAQLGAPKCRPQTWRAFLRTLEGKPRLQQIEAVNFYMNQRSYIEDLPNYGIPDYWATPREFLGKDGDCEDYAIAKYLSLRTLGFAEHQLRLAVVQDVNMGVPHAVLVVHHDGKAWLLDNQVKQVIDAANVRHYRPYFSINEKYWWLHKAASVPGVPTGAGVK